MRILKDNLLINEIFPENKEEKNFLNDLRTKSKLAYQIGLPKEGEIFIQNGKEFYYEEKKGCKNIYLPNFPLDLATSYYLRLILDSRSVRGGYLPLHAAAFNYQEKTFFLFGDSGNGKSFTLEKIKRKNKEILPLGDDHLIIGEGKIFGNDAIRQRTPLGNSTFYPLSSEICKLDNYITIFLNNSPKKKVKNINSNQIINDSRINNPILKYLINSPLNKKAENLFLELAPKEIRNKYLLLFKKFILSSKKNIFVSGNISLEEILLKW